MRPCHRRGRGFVADQDRASFSRSAERVDDAPDEVKFPRLLRRSGPEGERRFAAMHGPAHDGTTRWERGRKRIRAGQLCARQRSR